MDHTQFTLFAALLMGLAWYLLLRGRNRRALSSPPRIQGRRRQDTRGSHPGGPERETPPPGTTP